jgi:predicted transcriptional regulator
MAIKKFVELTKRERQIMNIIYKNKKATAQEVLDELPNPPSYSSVRALLRILEEKGFLKHTKQGAKYLFIPVISEKNAMKTDLKQLLKTYFNNSLSEAVTALLEIDKNKMEERDYEDLISTINKYKQEEK